jgi:hypothetical protein
MSLIITFMFEPAKLQMNCASASGTSILRSVREGRPAPTVSATSSPRFGARDGSRRRGGPGHQEAALMLAAALMSAR